MDALVERMLNDGYRPATIRAKLPVAATLNEWLCRRHLSLGQVDSARCREFSQYLARAKKHQGRNQVSALAAILKYLRAIETIAAEAANNDAQDGPLERDLVHYLVQERGIVSANTIATHRSIARRFFRSVFGRKQFNFNILTIKHVNQFILEYSATRSPGTVSNVTSVLRNILRFLRIRGLTSRDLAVWVPHAARRKATGLQLGMSPKDVHRLLRSCDCNTKAGMRDYAALLLLSRLGLRAIEVAFLNLDDIDWECGTIIVRSKGCERQLPLPQEVGDALARYVKHVRPKCSSQRVIVRMRAPYMGLTTSGGISRLMTAAIKRAGVAHTTNGTHQLRHGFAAELLRKGAALREIGGLMGHIGLDTTHMYARVDESRLRKLVRPWPVETGSEL